MKKITAVVAVALFAAVPATLFIWHSAWQSRATYGLADIKVLAEAVEDNGLTLTFRQPSETNYYCPGVRFGTHGPSIQFERPVKGPSMAHHYEFVRSSVGRTAQVDIQAKTNKDGTLSITFPSPYGEWEEKDRITLFDFEGNLHARIVLGPKQPKAIKANR